MNATTQEEPVVEDYLRNLHLLSPSQQQEILSLLGKIESSTAQQKARADFIAFVKKMWPGFIEGRHHRIMADAFQRVASGKLKRLMINMPPRHRLDIKEEIPTLSGWKTVETVVPGDYVFSPDGTPVLVTGKSAEYEEELYEVTTSDGQTIVCDGEHLWTVRFGSLDKPFITLSTKEILHKLDTETWREYNPPLLPRYAPLQYPVANLLIDPYVLGVWLGDGNSYGASVGCSYADMQRMRSQVEACGYATTHNPKFQQFNVLGLHVLLRESNLLRNKHIPENYLCASVQQRMALLQGLIDTDGDVTENGKVTFNNSSERLIDDVLCLLHSLGVKARRTKRQTHYNGVLSQPSYRLMFKLADAARLPRKASRCRAPRGNWSRSIDIRKTNRRGRVCCLEVANDDGLFIAGRGHLVTHNTKSEFASYLLVAWFLGLYPVKKVIQSSHTSDLATGFGRKVRNLIGSPEYQEVFPSVRLAIDNKAAGRWNTNKGGEYYAIGVGGGVTGKGADLFIIDDPHSEQEAKLAQFKPEIFDQAYEWYTSGPRQRLQPDAAIVIVATRWGKRDLCGQILKKAQEGEWEVIELPAILPSGSPLWPEFWPIDQLLAVKGDIPISKWNAQYQQNPTAEEGAIIKREWWNIWQQDDPPNNIEFIIQTWDTAFTQKTNANYSACTTWGIFQREVENGDKVVSQSNIILLDAFRKRMDFPELKTEAMRQYKYWKPDAFIVEAKATGAPLIFELRSMGIPVSDFTPVRGSKGSPNDKVARLNAVSDIFRSGLVWAPDRKWAEEVVEEVAQFPSGEFDDLVDTTTMAMLRYRQGGFLRLDNDEEDTEQFPHRRKRAYY